jgi:hypothetical protein
MITDNYINFYPIFVFIIALFAVVGIFWTVNSIIHAVITKDLIKKYPNVGTDFFKKTRYEQLVENNQEIYNLDKKFEANRIEQQKIWQAIQMLTELTKEEKDNG